jgi:hypothetical protein
MSKEITWSAFVFPVAATDTILVDNDAAVKPEQFARIRKDIVINIFIFSAYFLTYFYQIVLLQFFGDSIYDFLEYTCIYIIQVHSNPSQ